MGWGIGWASVGVFVVAWLVTVIIEPHLSPAFFSEAADLYPLLLLALAIQQRYFAFRDPVRQSPIPLLLLFAYAVLGGGFTLIAIGDPSTADFCVPYTVAGLVAMLFAVAMASVFPPTPTDGESTT